MCDGRKWRKADARIWHDRRRRGIAPAFTFLLLLECLSKHPAQRTAGRECTLSAPLGLLTDAKTHLVVCPRELQSCMAARPAAAADKIGVSMLPALQRLPPEVMCVASIPSILRD